MVGKSFVFRFADVEVREGEFSLTKAGERLAVEPKAFRVLLILLHNPGKLIPKQELLDAVWGDAAVTENSLARSVALLRKLLGDDARTPKFIETIATVGYRFLGSVEAVEDAVASTTPSQPVTAGLETHETRSAGSTAPTPPVANKPFAWKALTGSGIAVVVLLGGGFWYLRRPLPPQRIIAYTQITHDGRDKALAATDGNRLYFTQTSPNSIAQVGINGGEIVPVPITVPGVYMALMDVSPDGSNALISTAEEGKVNPIWVAPILGGLAKRLGDGESATFSPDGSSVIYSTSNGDIFLIRIDGSDQRKLASVGSPANRFRWSPDGKAIRFDRDGLLWEMSSDGSGIHRLLPDWKEAGGQCCGQWTSDGAMYLFRLDAGQTRNELWAIDERRGLFRPRPSAPIRLTSGPVLWGRPIPSRDGKKIFVRGATSRGELSRIDRKAGAPQPFLDGISAEFVSFSPDGKFVAYVAFPEGTLWKASRDGSNRMQFTQPPIYATNPRWSPDSKEILYMAATPDGHTIIRRVSAEDGTRLWLVSEETGDMHDPNWSPDGAKVLFGNGALFVPEKQDLRIVDLHTRQVTVVPGSAGKWSPRWSPDGRYLTAKVNPPIGHVAVFDLKLQRWLDLLVNGDVQFQSFSRDSKSIYFARCGKNQGVYRIPVTGGKEERVVDMSGWHLTGYVDCSMTLDPTDAPLVLRDVGTADIYALTLEEK